MTFLRTVLGDVPAAQAGVTYAHEHIIIDPCFATYAEPGFLLDTVESACVDLLEFRSLGGRTLVDSMPCSAGRNPEKLAAISRAADVNIICPTGLHLSKYYPPGHWSARLSAEDIGELFRADIERGVDRFDYNGPSIVRTAHRAGVIKVATGLEGIDPHQQKVIEAAAIAHHATGAPILTHTEEGTAALDQVELFGKLAVPLDHVCLSHTDRKPDAVYHREVLSTGVYVEYDSAFRWRDKNAAVENPTRDLVIEMFAAGFGSQLMLGMDAARRRYWHGYGGEPGIAFLLREFVPELLDAGLTQDDLTRIFVTNPAHCYSFAKEAM